jgi:cytochrome c oxidase subunit 2
MGKLFAAVVITITLISAYFVVVHRWWMPDPITAIGLRVDHQLNETMLEAGILFVLSQIILGVFAWRFGDTNTPRKIKHFPGGAMPLVIAGIAIVGLEILALSFVGSKVWADMYFVPAPADSLHVDVQAEQFAFYFRYPGPYGQFGSIHPEKINDGNGNYFGLDPANDVTARDDIIVGSLTVRVNKSVLLTLHSKDMIHNFYVPELRLQQDIVPGIDIPVHFTATKTGKFEIVCTQLCGLGHYNMRAYLEVVSQDQYDQWLKSQSQ